MDSLEAIGIHGILLMLTGVIHILFGLTSVAYRHDWAEFSKMGFWNQVLITSDRKMAAFWFVIAGPLFFIIGLAIYEMEIQRMALPVSLGWAMLTVAVLGTVMSPKSGFTVFLLPQAIYYLLSQTFIH